MIRLAVITAVANAPGLMRYGSKPLRDLGADPGVLSRIAARQRSSEAAVGCAPNQAYLGNPEPEALRDRPCWFASRAYPGIADQG